MIFMNVTWMLEYDGFNKIDTKVQDGGWWVNYHGYGHEIFNFRNIKGKTYGYAQAQAGTINIERLGANESDMSIDGQLVVFTAKRKQGGTCVVGWYSNATVYREYQYLRVPERKFNGEYLGYCTEAATKDVYLLRTEEERESFMGDTLFPRGKGGMGNSNIWFADSDRGKHFQRVIQKKIDTYNKSKSKGKQRKASPIIDTDAMKRVEKTAIDTTTAYYKNLGYQVKSVERENKGWDLEAKKNKSLLKIEVKGLSGSAVNIRLTKNEYKKMNESKSSYRLAIVTNCGRSSHNSLFIFAFNQERDGWYSEEGYRLTIDEEVSAVCYVSDEK